jgi:lysophospholipase L1-like esterase
VLCIGDSFTFGGGVETAQAWPQQLQGLVGPPERSGERILNGGANGWATGWQRIYLEQRALDQLHPDVVVLGWNWNDLNAAEGGPEDTIKAFIYAEGSWLHVFAQIPFVRETHLYRWFYARRSTSAGTPSEAQLKKRLQMYKTTMDQLGVDPEQKLATMRKNRFGDSPPTEDFWKATDTPAWRTAREEIGKMQALCAARGVAFVVAMLPEPSWYGPGTFPGVDRFGSMLDALGVPWVDLMPDFLQRQADGTLEGRSNNLWLRYDPVHPTAEGQAMFARAVARLLREKGLLDHKAP